MVFLLFLFDYYFVLCIRLISMHICSCFIDFVTALGKMGGNVHGMSKCLGCFSPHGHYFASGSQDRTGRLWSVDHYQPLRLFVGHLSDIDVSSLENSFFLFSSTGVPIPK